MKTSYRHTILNVDDDEGARYAKTRIFERAGYRVLEAETAAPDPAVTTGELRV